MSINIWNILLSLPGIGSSIVLILEYFKNKSKLKFEVSRIDYGFARYSEPSEFDESNIETYIDFWFDAKIMNID